MSQREISLHIAASKVVDAYCQWQQAKAVLELAVDNYQAIKATPEESYPPEVPAIPQPVTEPTPEPVIAPVIEPTPDPVIEVQPEPVIDQPQPEPEPVTEPTPEPIAPLAAPRRFFEFTDELAAYLTSDHRVTADAFFGLREIDHEEHVIAPGSAGNLEGLFESHFGAAQVQGLRWESSRIVSLDASTTVQYLGILTHGGSQYTEVEGYLA